MVGTLIGARRGTIPEAGPQYFSLGRWLKPLAWIGIAWSAVVMLYMTVPAVNHVAGEYTVYFEILGVLWFFGYLRSRIRSGEAGPPPPARPPRGGAGGAKNTRGSPSHTARSPAGGRGGATAGRGGPGLAT